MKPEILPLLACPHCGSPLELLGEQPPPGTELEQAELRCTSCGRSYPVVGGIPRLLPEGVDEPPASAHKWITFDRAQPEWEQNFLDLVQPLEPRDFLGRTVLDAGCGYGRHAVYAARYGATVLALDLSSEAVEAARRNSRDFARVHVVQGDIAHPPFRDAAFDLVYCLGVLHHLERPREAFRALHRLLPPGGRLATWVYGPRRGFALAVNGLLRSYAADLPPERLHRLARLIALGLRVFSHAPYRLLQGFGPGHALVSHLPVHDHHRWPLDVVVADIYDRLRVPVLHPMTGEELERWYEEDGYADILVTRRVRNSESFRGLGTRR